MAEQDFCGNDVCEGGDEYDADEYYEYDCVDIKDMKT